MSAYEKWLVVFCFTIAVAGLLHLGYTVGIAPVTALELGRVLVVQMVLLILLLVGCMAVLLALRLFSRRP